MRWGTTEEALAVFDMKLCPTKEKHLRTLSELGIITRRDAMGPGARTWNLDDCEALAARFAFGKRVPVLDTSPFGEAIRKSFGAAA